MNNRRDRNTHDHGGHHGHKVAGTSQQDTPDKVNQFVAGTVLPESEPVPCPELLTAEEAVRYLRLDIDGPKHPEDTLRLVQSGHGGHRHYSGK